MKLSGNVYLVEFLAESFESPWSSDSDHYVYPNPDYIISYSTDGNHTYFHQHQWTLHDYRPGVKTRTTINIVPSSDRDTTKASICLDQSKSILLALLRHAYKAPDEPLRLEQIAVFSNLLTRIRVYCTNTRKDVYEVLSSPEHVKELCDSFFKKQSSKVSGLSQLLRKLSFLPFRYVGFKPSPIPRHKPDDAFRASGNQTEIIPTGIFLNLLNCHKNILTKFLDSYSDLKPFIEEIITNPKYARGRNKGKYNFGSCARERNVQSYCLDNGITSVGGMSKHLGLIQYCSIMLIHTFTGMRTSEAYSLRGDSLERHMDGDIVQRRFLRGLTTKFKKRPTIVRWITSIDIELPFDAACKVAAIIYGNHGIDFCAQPIFVATSYLSFSSGEADPKTLCSPNPVWGNFLPSNFQHMINVPPITDQDVGELESLNPSRVWTAETRFSVGQRWPLTIHQIRRSVAVYAIRSGLVSLAALKDILKHISKEMSLYYAKGATFAKDLLKDAKGDKKAFIKVYQLAETLVRAWQYTNEFILTDEVLYGPHGLWLMAKKKSISKTVRYAELLEQTIDRMNKGALSYFPTPVGGCTSPEPCYKRMTLDFTGCNTCHAGVLKPSKVERLIAVQQVRVDSCPPGTLEHKVQIEMLVDMRTLALNVGVV